MWIESIAADIWFDLSIFICNSPKGIAAVAETKKVPFHFPRSSDRIWVKRVRKMDQIVVLLRALEASLVVYASHTSWISFLFIRCLIHEAFILLQLLFYCINITNSLILHCNSRRFALPSWLGRFVNNGHVKNPHDIHDFKSGCFK